MFTGIIEEVGEVRSNAEGEIVIKAKKVLWGTNLGDSIAVNGVDLTAATSTRRASSPTSCRRPTAAANLGDLRPGDPVNLERSIQLAGRLSGHIVRGVVEDTGTSTRSRPRATRSFSRINAPAEILRYVIMKGPVAIDGISLTVMAKDDRVVLRLAGAVHAGAHEPRRAQARGPREPRDGHHRPLRRGDAGRPQATGLADRRSNGYGRMPQSLPNVTEKEVRRSKGLATIEEAIEEFRNGRFVIIIDDEDRENEGDLTHPGAVRDARGHQLHGEVRPRPDLRADDGGAARRAAHPDDGEPQRLATSARRSPSASRRAPASPPASRAADRARTVQVLIDPKTQAERPGDARPHVPAARARGRRPRPRRPDRGDGRPVQARGPVPGRRALRDHERRRHDGAPARPQEFAKQHSLKIISVDAAHPVPHAEGEARPARRRDEAPDRSTASGSASPTRR